MKHHKLECERCKKRVSDRNYFTDERVNRFGGWGLVLCGSCAGFLENQPDLTEEEYVKAIKDGPRKRAAGPRKASAPKTEGVCQACLATHKVNADGNVVRHGWDFEHHGNRTGVHLSRCSGSGNPPLAVNCALSKSLIAVRNFRLATISGIIKSGKTTWEETHKLEGEFTILQKQALRLEEAVRKFHPNELLDDRPAL